MHSRHSSLDMIQAMCRLFDFKDNSAKSVLVLD
jgi:hypothetical protein